MATEEKRYFAFISYKREDEEWAKWLQHKLEHYKLPTSIRKEAPSLPVRVRPVFKDTTDLSGGVLEKAIKEALQSSKYLIVICSPRAAQSPWVCKEVQEFIDSGREEYIIPFIVEGEPHSKDVAKECFPQNLKELSGSRELLGININENGRDAAAIKVVARMFHLHYDSLWQRWERERRNHRRLIVGFSLLGMLIAFAIVAVMYYQHRKMQMNQARAVAHRATQLVEQGDSYLARKLLVEVLPDENDFIKRPYVPEAEAALRLAESRNSYIFKGHTNGVTSAVFSPDGKYIVSASYDNTIRLWDVSTGDSIRTFKGHTSGVNSVVFSPDGKYIVSASYDKTV
ncbi:MAG: TIR domain-containing protein, partial [Bacteroidaceae bacterium]|nr:TIR domain-containing protein [Bacteroidaceae bacterium]